MALRGWRGCRDHWNGQFPRGRFGGIGATAEEHRLLRRVRAQNALGFPQLPLGVAHESLTFVKRP